MNYQIIFEQLLVLLAVMATGYISFKVNILDTNGYSQLSSLVVRVLNPFLMISGVLGKRIAFSSEEIGQNIILVLQENDGLPRHIEGDSTVFLGIHG